MSVGKSVSFLLGILLTIALLITGCTGKTGPQGPDGLQGPQGPPGQNRVASPVADQNFGVLVSNGDESNYRGALKVHLTSDTLATPSTSQVVAVSIQSPPVIDGADGGAAEWGKAAAAPIALDSIAGANSGIATAYVRVAYDQRFVYVQVKWTEVEVGDFLAAADLTKGQWSYDSLHARWSQSGGEDKLYIVWQITNIAGWDGQGAGAILDGTNFRTNSSGELADLWVWQSTLTNYSGYIADKVVGFVSSGDGSQYDAGTVPAFYLENGGTNRPTYMKSGSPKTGSTYPLQSFEFTRFDAAIKWRNGATIPGYVFFEPSGSTADVEAMGGFDNGTWTVELRRQRATGYGDDAIF